MADEFAAQILRRRNLRRNYLSMERGLRYIKLMIRDFSKPERYRVDDIYCGRLREVTSPSGDNRIEVEMWKQNDETGEFEIRRIRYYRWSGDGREIDGGVLSYEESASLHAEHHWYNWTLAPNRASDDDGQPDSPENDDDLTFG